MRAKAWKWGLALGLSGAIHAGAAVFMLPRTPPVEVAGGRSVEIAMAGNAFADLSAAGEPVETVEPIAEAPAPLAPVEPDAPEPIEQMETAVADVPVAPSATPSKPDAPVEVEAAAEAPAPQATEIEPTTVEETLTAMVDIPRPTPRPHYEPPKQTRAATTRQAAVRAAAQESAGSGGRDRRDAKQGSAQNGQSASASSDQAAVRATARGNAAVSNYPGQILSRLRRALRYPREAQRAQLRGEVHVAFTVTSSGTVSGIRVVGSSGSPVLDKAAVETVQRAAPFPAIPPAAGRASWPFTVPLAFVR